MVWFGEGRSSEGAKKEVEGRCLKGGRERQDGQFRKRKDQNRDTIYGKVKEDRLLDRECEGRSWLLMLEEHSSRW